MSEGPFGILAAPGGGGAAEGDGYTVCWGEPPVQTLRLFEFRGEVSKEQAQEIADAMNRAYHLGAQRAFEAGPI